MGLWEDTRPGGKPGAGQGDGETDLEYDENFNYLQGNEYKEKEDKGGIDTKEYEQSPKEEMTESKVMKKISVNLI